MTARQVADAAPGVPLELVVDAGAELGEGPCWDAIGEQVLWVDIQAGVMHGYRPSNGEDREWPVGELVSAVVPRAGGGLLLALRDGFAICDRPGATPRRIATVEEHLPVTRLNDGKCDAAGRFWAGTMTADPAAGMGALYRLDVDHTVTRMLDGITISNGLGWNADSTRIYYIDSPCRRVDVFDFDLEHGTVANRRPFVTIPAVQGLPDGMTVDADDGIWVALTGGGAVHRYTTDGRLDRVLRVPVAQVTSCTFGGPELRDLYLTTASIDLTPEQRRAQPLAGGLFRCRPGVCGTPALSFKG